jgi:hypothetical protein
MMNSWSAWCSITGLLSLSLQAAALDDSATDYWVRVMPEAWFPKLTGNVAYRGSSGSDPTVLGTNDLGLGSRKLSPTIEAGVRFPFLFSIDAGYSSYSNSSDTTFSQSASFGDHTYAANTTVDTSMYLRDYWGEFGIRPLNLSTFGFGIGIAGHLVRGDLELKDEQSGTDDALAKTIIIPALSLRAHVTPVSHLTIEARVHIFDAGIAGQHVDYTDAVLQVSYRPIAFIGILGGYRYTRYDLHLHAHDQNNEEALFDLRLQGPFAGLIAQF